MQLPSVGEDIYVETRWSIDHGEDDVQGGLGEVTKIEHKYGSHFVYVKEVPNGYNWGLLYPKQDELRKEFGRKRARPDPDHG